MEEGASWSVGNQRSQGFPEGQHRNEFGKRKPASNFILLCQGVCCQQVTERHCALGGTGPPGGLGARLLFHTRMLAGKAQKRRGLEEEGKVKHILVQMRNLEFAFPE